MQFKLIVLIGRRIQSNISITVVQEEDIFTIVNKRRLADVAIQLMPSQMSMIQIEDQIFTNYQQTMASLVNLSTTTQSKKASVSMIMVRELVE
jgi:hypothetical protein